jgi:Predicted ATP-dependent Lon-type protease
VAKKKKLLLRRWCLLETSIRVWMCCWKPPVCSHLFHRKWEQIQHFSIVCIVIFQDGRYRSSDRSILPMITVLSVIIWQSSSESSARSSMEMHLTTTSVWGEIWISVIQLRFVVW